METFLRSFSCPCNGVHCTAAVQPVARLLSFVVAYFLRLVYTRNSSGDDIVNVNFLYDDITTKYNTLVHKFCHRSTP